MYRIGSIADTVTAPLYVFAHARNAALYNALLTVYTITHVG
jgi:hypothetical protein